MAATRMRLMVGICCGAWMVADRGPEDTFAVVVELVD